MIRMKRVMGLYDKNAEGDGIIDKREEGAGIIW